MEISEYRERAIEAVADKAKVASSTLKFFAISDTAIHFAEQSLKLSDKVKRLEGLLKEMRSGKAQEGSIRYHGSCVDPVNYAGKDMDNRCNWCRRVDSELAESEVG